MIASLGMYDRAEVQPANDRFWALIRDALRARGFDAPDRLTRGEAAYAPAWDSPDLLLSQTCGYPYRARLHGHVTLVGTPDYGLEGCAPGYYRSLFIARADDPRHGLSAFDGARFVYNDALSQSGWAGPIQHATTLRVRFALCAPSGGHVASAQQVAMGNADLAGIDAQTWRMIEAHDPALAGRLRVVGATPPAPGLPLITARRNAPEPIAAAVAESIAALTAEDREALGLRGLVFLSATDYLAVPTPAAPAQYGQVV